MPSEHRFKRPHYTARHLEVLLGAAYHKSTGFFCLCRRTIGKNPIWLYSACQPRICPLKTPLPRPITSSLRCPRTNSRACDNLTQVSLPASPDNVALSGYSARHKHRLPARSMLPGGKKPYPEFFGHIRRQISRKAKKLADLQEDVGTKQIDVRIWQETDKNRKNGASHKNSAIFLFYY